MDKFTELEIALLFLTIGYGIVFGVSNTLHRVGSMLGFGKYHQGGLGQLLDILFYAAVGYLCYIYFA